MVVVEEPVPDTPGADEVVVEPDVPGWEVVVEGAVPADVVDVG